MALSSIRKVCVQRKLCILGNGRRIGYPLRFLNSFNPCCIDWTNFPPSITVIWFHSFTMTFSISFDIMVWRRILLSRTSHKFFMTLRSKILLANLAKSWFSWRRGGLIAEIEANPKNEGSKNKGVFSSCCPTCVGIRKLGK